MLCTSLVGEMTDGLSHFGRMYKYLFVDGYISYVTVRLLPQVSGRVDVRTCRGYLASSRKRQRCPAGEDTHRGWRGHHG